jgi:4a-hydroxytetrahydrobiopterin dehydratase
VRKLLTEEELGSIPEQLPGWAAEGRELVRGFRFGSFAEALAFVNRVGAVAEELDHHPEIQLSYNKVKLRLTTHDSGGLTKADLRLAQRISDFHTSTQTDENTGDMKFWRRCKK